MFISDADEGAVSELYRHHLLKLDWIKNDVVEVASAVSNSVSEFIDQTEKIIIVVKNFSLN